MSTKWRWVLGIRNPEGERAEAVVLDSLAVIRGETEAVGNREVMHERGGEGQGTTAGERCGEAVSDRTVTAESTSTN